MSAGTEHSGGRHGPRSAHRDGASWLVVRFAILSAIGLALAAGAIVLVVRHLTTNQAERAATAHAQFVGHAVLGGELRVSDFDGPVEGRRRAALDELLLERVLVDGTLLVALVGRDGIISYSNDHTLIGGHHEDFGRLSEVLAGTALSEVTTAEVGDGGTDTKVLRTLVPVPVGRADDAGVMALYQDYAPIAHAAEQAFFPVAGVLEVALLGLYVALLPALRRVTRRIRAQVREIQHLALHDDLTGLPNRTLFGDRGEQAIRAARRSKDVVAVMLIDLDRFKEINDALGHRSGDVLLQELGHRLRGVLRESETLARLGGDEFAVLLPRTSPKELPLVAGRIQAALEKPFVLDGLPLRIEGSVGIAVYPDSGLTVDSLIQRADVAMYSAKHARSGFAFYDPREDPNDPGRLALVGELRRAIDRSELALAYQVLADVRTGRIRGAETLVRWRHPERGLLPPGEFVPLAERTGLIGPLTRFVLVEALRDCCTWRSVGLDLHVAVNVAMPNLLDLRFPTDVAEALAASGIEPSRLTLEITETAIMADPFRARQVLERLGEMGIRLAIDDFGTGYSSLAYLKHLPVHELKIDRSFVEQLAEDPSDRAIVRSTIELGRDLGLEVVAEGVESVEVRNALLSLGCSLAQGHLFGKPMSNEELLSGLGISASEWRREPVASAPDGAKGEIVPVAVVPARAPIVSENDHGLRVLSAPGS